jgi:hypothetical protein
LLKQPPQKEEDYTLTKKAVTDATGRFALTLKPSEVENAPRRYLIASADGFGLAWAELSKDEKPAELTLRLVKDAPVQGRVLDTQGKPIAAVKFGVTGVQVAGKDKVDAYLKVWKQNWHDTWRAAPQPLYALLDKVLQTAPTDKDGRFTIRGLGVERVATVQVSGSTIAKATLYVVTRPGFDAKPYNRAVLEDQRMRLGHVPSLHGPNFDYIATPTRVVEGAGSGRALSPRGPGRGAAVAPQHRSQGRTVTAQSTQALSNPKSPSCAAIRAKKASIEA